VLYDTGAVQGRPKVLSTALQENAAASSRVCRLNKEEKCMPVAHWNLWTEFETFEHVLNRALNLPFPRLFDNGHHESWQPCTDISETDETYVVEVDLPGMTMHDISVRLDDTTVVIAGQRQRTPAGSVKHQARVERPCGTFQRAFTLPTAVQRDAVQATYAHGVLTITVPKADAARPRHITVQAA
jgi:HSP20 family protein